MKLVTNTPATALDVARSRWDEASRVTAAYKIQRDVRKRRAWELTGQAGELDAWARVAEADRQLEAAEALEVKAWQEVAWAEKGQADQRTLKRARANSGR